MLTTQVLSFLAVICLAIRPRTLIELLRLYVVFLALGVGPAGFVG